jgi:hypothetical protein
MFTSLLNWEWIISLIILIGHGRSYIKGWFFVSRLRLIVLTFFGLVSSAAMGESFGVGDSYIASFNYPKFSVGSDISVLRHYVGFADKSLRMRLPNRFDGDISFEAGILKYMNLGAIFSGSLSDIKNHEPIDYRMGLFVKPFFSLHQRVAFFSRLTGGLVVSLCINGPASLYYAKEDDQENLKAIYQDQDYKNFPVGGFLSAAIGVEVFLLSRLGLTIESGVRASFFHTGKKMPFMDPPKYIAGVPDSFNFMTYEVPVSVILHVIL